MGKNQGPGPRPRTSEWKAPFLAYLREHPNVLQAAKYAQVERKWTYKAREIDPEFAAAWDEAIQEAIDRIEAIAMDNALDPDYHHNVMRIFLLKRWKPERYRDVVQNEITGAGGGEVVLRVIYDEPNKNAGHTPTDAA